VSRRRLLLAAVGGLVVGLVAGGALLFAASGQVESAVDGLARAPVGCETTLTFTGTGNFWIYVETRGEASAGGEGSCALPPSWDVSSADAPEVELTLTDSDGGGVALEPGDSLDYDVGSAEGTSVATFELSAPGDYLLRVRSAETGFAVAVGRDPNDAGTVLAVAGVAVAGVAVLVALVLAVKGIRRTAPRTVVAAPGAVWQPGPPDGAAANVPPPPVWTPAPPSAPPPPPSGGPTLPGGPRLAPTSAPATPTTPPTWAPPTWQTPDAPVRDDA
jgi:hypothetical protein